MMSVASPCAPPSRMLGQARERLRQARSTLADGMAGLANEVATLIATVVSFTVLGRRLGPGQYGSLVAMYGLIGIAICIAYIGPGLAMMQSAMKDGLHRVVGSFYGQQLLFTVLSFVVVFAVAPLIVPSVSIGTFAMFLVAELVGTAMLTTAVNIRIVATGYRSALRLQVIPQFLKVAVLVPLAVFGDLTLESYGLAWMIGSVVLGAGALLVVTGRLGVPLRPRGVRGEEVRSTLSFSSTIWAMGLHDGGDKLVMSAARVGPDLGLYAAAYRLLQFGNIPVNALSTSSYRSFLDPAVGNQKRRAIRFSLVATLYTTTAALAVIIFAPIVLPVLVGDGFSGSVAMARWLAPLLVLRGFLMFASNALAGLGRVHARFMAHVASAAIGIAVYVALIPSLSWRGAVIGSYITDAVLISTMWILLLRTKTSIASEPDDFAIAEVEDDRATP